MFNKDVWNVLIGNDKGSIIMTGRSCSKTYMQTASAIAYTASIIAHNKGFIKTDEEVEEYYNEIFSTALKNIFGET